MSTITTPAPTTMFDVAAAQLGDPLAWWQMASLNAVPDPWLAANVVLTIPPAGTAANDGLPPQ